MINMYGKNVRYIYTAVENELYLCDALCENYGKMSYFQLVCYTSFVALYVT